MTSEAGFMSLLLDDDKPIRIVDLNKYDWTIIGTRSHKQELWEQPWVYSLSDPDPHNAVAEAREAGTIMTMQRRRRCERGARPVYDLMARLVPVEGKAGKLW